MLDYRFDPDGVYLAAATYGPESMALLDMMEKAGVKPIVCFVNYHKAEINEKAEAAMKEYCAARGLTLEICDTGKLDQGDKDRNFEGWAREVRYSFFAKAYKKHKGTALFLAHTQDDVIESYLLTKRYGGKMSLKGLSPVSTYRGMMIVSPLLNYSLDDIMEYIRENNVPYSQEAKDFDASASRSEIRRDIVEKLNEVERDQVLSEIRKEYDDKMSFVNAIGKSIATVDSLNIREIIALSPDDFAQTIMDFIDKKAAERCKITPEILFDIRKMCLDPTPNMAYKLQGDIYLTKEYDELFIDNDGLDLPYSYTLKKPGKLSCPTFDLDFSMGAEDRNIHETDYPLTVRSVLPQDVYIYGGYLEPVKKMLLASGISQRLLHVWPVFLDKNGRIIYVPHYKKGFSEHHASILNIHVKNDEK